jgi:hypothetical protein
MKMKFILSKKFEIIFVICLFNIINKTYSSNTENNSSLQNHFKMMTQFKIQSKMFLNNLFETANTHSNYMEKTKKEKSNEIKFNLKRIEKSEKTNTNTNTESKMKTEIRKEYIKQKNIKHSSDYFQDRVLYKQYKYIKYEDIISKMKKLAKKYPKFLKVDTAQKLYGLPNPGGYCGKNKKK